MKTKIFIAFLIIFGCDAAPITETEDNSENAKGILDGVAGGSTTTSKPGGLNALPGLSAASNTGPMLIIGGFQAIVTKFDPSLVQGLPGLAGLPQVPSLG